MAINIKLARSTIPPQDGNDSCSIDYAPTAGQAKVRDVTVSRPTLEFGKFASIITPNFKGMNDQEYQFTMDAAVKTVGTYAGDAQGKVVLSHEELSLLLGGIDLAKTKHKRWYRKAAPDGRPAA